jgi:SulP family sulfate permease
LTVFVDLITAVIAGVVLASLAFVKQMADLQLESIKDLENASRQLIPSDEKEILKDVADFVTLFDFSGPLSFGAAADLGHHVRLQAKGTSALVIDFLKVPFLDVSAARAVATICQDAAESKKRIFISGVNLKVKEVLMGLQGDSVLPEMFYESRVDALRASRDFVQASQKN